MNKRERLEHAIAGEAVDRPPVMLYRHWQGDDQRSADLARAIFAFQNDFDWDMVVAAPTRHFLVTGYGVTDEWRDHPTGVRSIIKRPITRSLDWTELRTQEPERGDIGKQLECIRLLGNAFEGDGTPFVSVVYSPLTQAIQLAGRDELVRQIRMHPDRVKTGLNTLTESTLRFIEALRRTSISGILYVMDMADYASLSPAEYLDFGVPYDLKLLESLPDRWWLNIASVQGSAPMLQLITNYPVSGFNWQDQAGHPNLDHGLDQIPQGALCGGLSIGSHLNHGTPTIIQDAARQAFLMTARRRLILSTDQPIWITTPRSNIQAVRDSVES